MHNPRGLGRSRNGVPLASDRHLPPLAARKAQEAVEGFSRSPASSWAGQREEEAVGVVTKCQ